MPGDDIPIPAAFAAASLRRFPMEEVLNDSDFDAKVLASDGKDLVPALPAHAAHSG